MWRVWVWWSERAGVSVVECVWWSECGGVSVVFYVFET